MRTLLIIAVLVFGWYIVSTRSEGAPPRPSGIVRSTATMNAPVATAIAATRSLGQVDCDPAYPETRTCIAPGPPFNQGCAITSERRFTVLSPDPQALDHDGDGIGC